MTAEHAVVAWLDAFADAVRSRDIPRGRTYFAADCRSFGTRAVAVDGLDELVEQQWLPTWMATSGFTFDLDSMSLWSADDGSHLTVAARWTSDGFHGGAPRARSGRSSIVLRRDRSGPTPALLAVHSHFSTDPVLADRTV